MDRITELERNLEAERNRRTPSLSCAASSSMGGRVRRTEGDVTEKARERVEAQYKKYGIESMGSFGGKGKGDRLMTTMAEEETIVGARFGMGKGPEVAEAAHRPGVNHRDRPIHPPPV